MKTLAPVEVVGPRTMIQLKGETVTIYVGDTRSLQDAQYIANLIKIFLNSQEVL
jgi:hypothetical protein